MVKVLIGMGDADVAAAEIAKREEEKQKSGIPGLDWSYEEKNEFERKVNAIFYVDIIILSLIASLFFCS